MKKIGVLMGLLTMSVSLLSGCAGFDQSTNHDGHRDYRSADSYRQSSGHSHH